MRRNCECASLVPVVLAEAGINSFLAEAGIKHNIGCAVRLSRPSPPRTTADTLAAIGTAIYICAILRCRVFRWRRDVRDAPLRGDSDMPAAVCPDTRRRRHARQRRAATANRRGLGAAARARAQRHPSAARARRLVVCTFLCERKRGFERPRAQDAAGASRREQAKPAARGTHPLSACVGAPRLARATLRFAGGRAPAADCSRRGPARCSSTSSGPVRSKRARSRVGGGAGV